MKINNTFPTILGLAIAIAPSFTSSAQALVGDVNVNANIGVEGASSSVITNTQIRATTSGILYHTVDTDTEADMEVEATSDAQSEVTASNDNKVTVVYKRPAKLFGFISTQIREEVSVEVGSDGSQTVEVKKSWWSIFAKSEAKVEEFETAIKSRLGASAQVSAGGELSASERARLEAEIDAAAVATYE